ncbi:SDR family oxidoreductase [Mammaliicoccus sciuri]|uniref:elongation factor P 5-aminopentanone reductase n=1 Tax=Mammaliicoccus sciuri TaxID=1296 RepID=UPI0021D337F8|nr:SDR family oxidoreductase [Mammaliicoccus sciuri]UXU82840.1 SDR family oxidoreductase [Mammaliicoccus sciuri]UXU92686.1 SDR family oxidoreductase [Mammaliicoccus sciuri]UXV14586.1 SDR family oxidoreductase [Mammaliicoccus sciuri]UXV22900.1 SDR family oxidoreductase [Mammaliicoccus sciuri]UXV25630.1 SDR family oxidoreductase [Mammaliicoccus sciuri]
MARTFIVGGSGDIGLSIVDECLSLGHEVILHYNQSKINELKQRYAGQPVTFLQFDLTNIANLQSLTSIGHIDQIIYAAGQSSFGAIQDFTDDDINVQYNLNVYALIKIVQLFVDDIRKSENGRIIVISSIWGETGASYETIYSTMKAAQLGFVKSLAKELALTSITVNAICPGVVHGKMTDELDEITQTQLKDEIPQGRFVQTKEVAATVGYLLNPLSQSVTGQVLRVNGGWYI